MVDKALGGTVGNGNFNDNRSAVSVLCDVFIEIMMRGDSGPLSFS